MDATAANAGRGTGMNEKKTNGSRIKYDQQTEKTKPFICINIAILYDRSQPMLGHSATVLFSSYPALTLPLPLCLGRVYGAKPALIAHAVNKLNFAQRKILSIRLIADYRFDSSIDVDFRLKIYSGQITLQEYILPGNVLNGVRGILKS